MEIQGIRSRPVRRWLIAGTKRSFDVRPVNRDGADGKRERERLEPYDSRRLVTESRLSMKKSGEHRVTAMEIHGMSFSSISLASRSVSRYICPCKRYHTFELGEFQPVRIDEAREKRTTFLFSQFVRLALVPRGKTSCREFAGSCRTTIRRSDVVI